MGLRRAHEQVDRPGQFFVRELLGESIIVTRAPSGRVNAFYNVCRHRGTKLCTELEGTFAGSIQCPYHAWTYDLEGRWSGAPHMEEVPHFRKDDYPLHRVHCDEWDGHIFLNLSPEPQPLAEQLADLPGKFRPWRMEDLRLGHRIVYDVQANWKLLIQNYNECLHCPNLHPALNKLSHYLSGENEPLRATYMGGRMDLRPGVATLSMDGTCPRAFLPGPARRRTRGGSTTTRSSRTCSSACTPTTCSCTRCGRSRRRARSTSANGTSSPRSSRGQASTHRTAIEFWDMTNRQDWHVCELSQAGIALARLHAGTVLESRGPALRVRPDDRRRPSRVARWHCLNPDFTCVGYAAQA